MLGRYIIVSLISAILPAMAIAGPPFRTDDPEPVEYEHWEFYVASQGSFSRDESMMGERHFDDPLSLEKMFTKTGSK
jgi:hypothetical protein